MTPHPNPASLPLWRWVSTRVVVLVIGTAITVGFCMWLRFAVWNAIVVRRMPDPVRIEFQHLLADPHHDQHRLLQIIDQYYGLDYVYPEIANADWWTLGGLLLTAMPVILLLGWWMSRPASRQFSHVAHAARQVARGDFSTRASVIERAPEELTHLALDFNAMIAKLEQYEREIQDSSAILAHELRTPLNAAMGRLQGMIDGVFAPEPEQLLMIMRKLEQLNRLVADLHLLSLARAGQLVLDKSQFHLNEMISECLSWAAPQIERIAMRVNQRIDPALMVEADRNRLRQVFSILIDNTLRYAADGGQLDVDAFISNDCVTTEFSDRGCGIDPKDLARIFDRFWRAESSRARHSGGSGLGLSIASAICIAHGGSITAVNRGGGGAAVRVSLPIRAAVPPDW